MSPLPPPIRLLVATLAVALIATTARASNLLDLPADEQRDPRIDGVWYIKYVHEDVHQRPDQPDRPQDFSRFEVQRGYVTFRTRIAERIRARVTSDISVDQEGDGAGDIELRLKYGYVEIETASFLGLHTTRFRAGVIPTPWLDFEQSVNDFRLQGPMFLNRERVFISADYGIGYHANLGARLDEDYRTRVNRRDAGRRGSFALGVFNGGGYNEIERNENTVFQARLSLRPLPDVVPGLQISGGYGSGRGNTARAPEYRARVLMLSHESTRGVITLTAYDGVGDIRGATVDENGEALDQTAVSAFGELRFLRDYSLIGRFDRLTTETHEGDHDLERWIVGVAWRVAPGGQLLVDYENEKFLGAPLLQRNEQIEVGFELRF